MNHSINEQTLYGEYNWDDPIYRVLRRETASPRFKIFLMQKGRLNQLFYQYTDALALKPRNGDDLDDLFRKQRRLLVDEGIVTSSNEKMRDFLLENGTPYADLEQKKFEYGDIWCG